MKKIILYILIVVAVGIMAILIVPSVMRSPNWAIKDDVVWLNEYEGWKTYNNESLGLEFKYPSSYNIKKIERIFFDYDGRRAVEIESLTIDEIDQIMILEDSSRTGSPRITISVNPDGIGGICHDTWYDVDIVANTLEVKDILEHNKDEQLSCDYTDDVILFSPIGNSPLWNYVPENISKNEILLKLTYSEGDYQDEFGKILNSFYISKPEIYGSPANGYKDLK